MAIIKNVGKKGTGKKGTGKMGTEKKGTRKMGAGKKGTSEKLGKRAHFRKRQIYCNLITVFIE